MLTECAQPWWTSDCNGAIDAAQAYINNKLPGGAVDAVRRDPQPRADAPRSWWSATRGSSTARTATPAPGSRPAEETRLNATADLLNRKLSSAASARGFAFANPTSRFVGHAVCDDVEWLNGLSNPISESYHPNRTGHASGYAPLVSPLLTGATLTVSAATLRAAAASGDGLAAQQRAYAAAGLLDRAGDVHRPRPDQPGGRAAARRAGVDLDRWLARH